MQSQFAGAASLPILLFASTLGLSAAVSAAPVLAQSSRLIESSGGFSYVPPAGWHVKTALGIKYKMCYAPPSNGFSPNIIVSEDSSPLSLDTYQKASNVGLKQSYTAIHIVSQTPFATTSGLRGLRIAVVGVPTKLHLVQVFYLFSATSTRKLVAVVSWSAADGNKYAPIADKSMKTFRLQ